MKVVLSQPIEVFSHSQYLHKANKDSQKTMPSEPDCEQGREKLSRTGQNDSVHIQLMAALKAFRDSGRTKEMAVQCLETCFDEDLQHCHPSDPTATSLSKTAEHRQRRTKKGQESPVQSSSLPSLREQLGSVLEVIPSLEQSTSRVIYSKHISDNHPLLDPNCSPQHHLCQTPSSAKLLPSLSSLSLLPPTSTSSLPSPVASASSLSWPAYVPHQRASYPPDHAHHVYLRSSSACPYAFGCGVKRKREYS